MHGYFIFYKNLYLFLFYTVISSFYSPYSRPSKIKISIEKLRSFRSNVTYMKKNLSLFELSKDQFLPISCIVIGAIENNVFYMTSIRCKKSFIDKILLLLFMYFHLDYYFGWQSRNVQCNLCDGTSIERWPSISIFCSTFVLTHPLLLFCPQSLLQHY